MKTNKKGAIGATMDWIIGTPLIAGILIILIVFSFLIFVSQGGGGKITEDKIAMDKWVMAQKAIDFLETPFEEGRVEDLIKGDPKENKEDYEKFKMLAFDFADKALDEEKYSRMWLRIYDLEDQPKLERSALNKYAGYDVWAGGKTRYDSPCDPFPREVLFQTYYSLYFEIPLKDKKIVGCFKYK